MSLWICADEITNKTHFYYFEKTIPVSRDASLSAHVCADTRYQLYINQQMVCEGPCQGSANVRYYETVDLTPYLIEGENHICAKVMHLQENSFKSVFKESRAAFWFHGTLTDHGEVTHLGSDETWTCYRDDSVSFHHCKGIHSSVPPFEEVFGDPLLSEVTVKGMYQPNIQNMCYNQWGVRELYPLQPRPIPQMQQSPMQPMKVIRQGEDFIEFDAGTYITAKVALDFCASKDAVIRVIYAECYSVKDTQGNGYKSRRDAYDDPTAFLDGAADILHATGSAQVLKPFWYRSFRFIRVEFPADAQFEIRSLTFGSYFYPLDSAGHFECSDSRFNDMWQISRNTVLCCMHEIYVDCPYYEQQQYCMDSALEMLFAFRLGSDRLMPLKALTDLAHSQMPSGMLQANYPSTDVQIIPNFTLFWVFMLRDHLRYTGDTEGVRPLMGTLDKALEAFENLKNRDGLIDPTPHWAFVDWVPAWPDGVPAGGKEEPLTVTCLMFAAALKAGAEICTALGRTARAQEYTHRAQEMIQSVKNACYDTTVGLFKNTPTREEYSQHTTLWAILSGAVSGAEAGALIDRTFSSDLDIAACTFSMNHYMFRALELADRYCYAPHLFAGWHTMLDLHCTSWCENPGQPRSECHGWSSAPIYEFSAMVLGVYPTQDGYKSVRIRPYIADLGLTWAKGTVPTPFGIISLSWRIDGDLFTIRVDLPDNAHMDAVIEMPNGDIINITEAETLATCQI